jgi:hypothetical protein
MISPPILLTSSVIAMDSTVLLKDGDARIYHTIESLKRWGEIVPNGNFVLCDGSGFDFTNLVKEKFPNLDIECLSFLNDSEQVKLRGKGFGEGEIIRYALIHSSSLGRSSWFAKCTAKLWVDNFQECIKEWNGRFLCKAYFSNVFSFKKTTLEYIDTRFYMADKFFYATHFSDAHLNLLVDSGVGIEEKFLDVVDKQDFKKILFRTSPVVSGVGGGSGKYYNTSIIRRIKEVLRLKLVYLTSKYQALFN